MIKLSREIRFALARPAAISARSSANTWAGWPSSPLLVPHGTLRCELRGEPDPVTGYLCNIKVVDQLLQNIVTQDLIPAYWQAAEGLVITEIMKSIQHSILGQWPQLPGAHGEVELIELTCSPYTKFFILSQEPNMVWLTQQFEFSAAHRLHCRQLSEEQNRQVFGKCNHPAGHGHNYVVEVTIGIQQPLDGLSHFTNGIQQPLDGLGHLESVVKQTVIDRLDHKHLNEDIECFRELNPSVENIAKQIFVWLKPELSPTPLKRVRVYETPKTWAECDADD